jgi:hypothetical protein
MSPVIGRTATSPTQQAPGTAATPAKPDPSGNAAGSKNAKNNPGTPDAAKAEPVPHERPPVRSDDN